MKAYLVEVSLLTRVLLPEHFDVEEFRKSGKGTKDVVAVAEAKLIDKIRTDLADKITTVEEDLEVPYDPEHDGSQFCDTCKCHISHTIDGVRKRHCRTTGEPLGPSMWQGCALHKPREKKEK